MSPDEVLEVLTGLLAEIVDDDELELRREMTADEVDDWDSLAHVRFVVDIEARFGLRFEVDEIGAPKNVGELVDLVHSKLA